MKEVILGADAYDHANMSFSHSDSNRTALSSYDLDKLKKNADGGITTYVGPKAPQWLEANWIPTAGGRPLPTIRLYCRTDAFNNKTFKLPVVNNWTRRRRTILPWRER